MIEVQDPGFRYVRDFTEYGNQPKTIAIAINTRLELWSAGNARKQRMNRRRAVAGRVRANGRIDVCEPDAWHRDNRTRKGRSWMSSAPRSPAVHWLRRHDYQQFPF